jgi:hypothetical protein
MGARAPKQAMQRFACLQRPVYITETGIADTKDTLRAEWAEAYFKAVLFTCRLLHASNHQSLQMAAYGQ